MEDEMETAVNGDELKPGELIPTADDLRAMANDMEALKTDTMAIEDVQRVGRAQANLRNLAGQLVVAQIDLIAGEAKVTADHIQSAVEFANGVMRKVADFKKRLAQVTAVLAFVAVVLTGNGDAIVTAAFALKEQLSS
jgi:hypothetical protein